MTKKKTVDHLAGEWPADNVERWPLARVIPDESNARTHSEEQVEQIVASMREWGWTIPVLVDENDKLIAGHGRVLAAQSLGLPEVPVMVARGWTEAQKRAYLIADNKLAMNAGWDHKILALDFNSLRESGFDLTLTGFAELELDQFFATGTTVDSEWKGMPEFNEPDVNAFRSLIVHFRNQEDVEEFEALLSQHIGQKAKSIWHPELEREKYIDKRYAVSA